MSASEQASRKTTPVGFTSPGPVNLRDLEAIGQQDGDTTGAAEFVSEIVELFLRLAPRLHAAAEEAVQDGDCRSLAGACHKLKSQASYMGAQRLVSVCGQLEALGLDEDLRRAEPVMADLEDELDRVIAALQPYRRKRSRKARTR